MAANSSLHLRAPSVIHPETSLWDLLEHRLNVDGPKVAAADSISHVTITLDQLRIQSDELVRHLQSLQQSVVGLCMEPSIDMLVAFISLARLNLTYVTIDPSLPIDRVRYIIQDCGVSTVITTSEYWKYPGLQKVDIIDLTSLPVQDQAHAQDVPLPISKDPESTIAIIYTSGSTGKPKGVKLSYRALMNRLIWQWREAPFRAGDVAGAKTKTGFVDSVAETWAPFLQGVPLVYIANVQMTNITALLDTIDNHQISLLTVVPSLLQLVLYTTAEQDRKLPNLRQVVSSGEALSMNVCEKFFSLLPDCSLGNYYGSTETMGDISGITYTSLKDVQDFCYRGFVAAGSLVDNNSVSVVSADTDGVGEFVFTGCNLATGYLHTDSNDQIFVFSSVEPDPQTSELPETQFWSGDLGKILHGKLIPMGRVDRTVKIGGNKINLLEVEMAIQKHLPFKVPPAVICYNGQILAHYQEDEERVQWHLGLDRIRKWLPGYAVPTFVPVRCLPRLPASGKVDYGEVMRRVHASKDVSATSEELRARVLNGGHIESRLVDFVQIFQNTVHSTVDRDLLLDVDFFTAGGNSLNALSFIQNLRSAGFQVTLSEFFNMPTLMELFQTTNGKGCVDQVTTHMNVRTAELCKTNSWSIVPINDANKEEAIALIMHNFACEALTIAIGSDIAPHTTAQSGEFLCALMPFAMRTPDDTYISFGLQNLQGHLVGVCLSFADDHLPTPEALPTIHDPIMEFLDMIEEPITARLKKEGFGSILHGFVTAIVPDLIPEPARRVEAIMTLERHLVEIAPVRGFDVVLTTNTGLTTQDVAVMLGYIVDCVVDLRTVRDTSGNPVFPNAAAETLVKVCHKVLRSS